jgi:hypothetical protein
MFSARLHPGSQDRHLPGATAPWRGTGWIAAGDTEATASGEICFVSSAQRAAFHTKFSAVHGITHALLQQKTHAQDDPILRFFIERPEPVSRTWKSPVNKETK